MDKKVVGVLIVAVVIAVVAVAAILSTSFEPSTKQPAFKIVDENFHVGMGIDENFNTILNYTVYVKVRNDGADGTKTVWCEVIRADLSTIKKSQSMFLSNGQEKTATFFFSHSEIKGAVPDNYDVWIA